MSWHTSSVWLKTALFAVLLATLLFVLGFATNDWMDNWSGTFSWGLWRAKWCGYRTGCTTGKITTSMLETGDMEVWFRAVQVFECVGLICVAIAFIVVLIVVFLQTVRKRMPLLVLIISCFAGVAAIIVGVVIFTTNLDGYDVGWSMGVAIAGAVFLFIAGIMFVIDLNR